MGRGGRWSPSVDGAGGCGPPFVGSAGGCSSPLVAGAGVCAWVVVAVLGCWWWVGRGSMVAVVAEDGGGGSFVGNGSVVVGRGQLVGITHQH